MTRGKSSLVWRYKLKRFGRRLKGWANYMTFMPRWFYILLLFFSGWGVSTIAKQVVDSFR
jgi:hypothetical protein